MNSKLKIVIGLIYLICLSSLLYYLFSKYDLKDLVDINFLKENKKIFAVFKEQNTFLVSVAFFLFSVIWVLLLGFGSIVAIAGGFIFGKWLGALLVITSCTVGATLLYILGLVFFKDFIEAKLAPRLGKFKTLFNQNETLYFALYRLSGGGLPFFMQNLLPVIFSMKVKNYYWFNLSNMSYIIIILPI